MSEGRYNIPRQYKVDKGMPLNTLFEKIDNLKCRKIFETELQSVEWCYQLADKEGIANVAELMKEKGLSIFEVSLKRKISPDLLTEVFAEIIRRPMVLVYLCGEELAMGAAAAEKICAADFYPHDMEHMIDLIDYDTDYDKSTEQIHERIFDAIRKKKRELLIDREFKQVSKDKEKEMMSFEFSLENLDRIRADADFVQSRLRVV